MGFQRNLLPDPIRYFESEGLRLAGRGKWRTTRCPVHGGETLRINVETGEFCCIGACEMRGGDVLAFHMAIHGSSFEQAAKALGAWVPDRRKRQSTKPAPMSIRAALSAVRFESAVLGVAARSWSQTGRLSEKDRVRIAESAKRIRLVLEHYL